MQALPDVNAGRICAGCGQSFVASRAGQRHCRPSCRVLAYRQRRAASALDLLAAGSGAGYVDPEVVANESCGKHQVFEGVAVRGGIQQAMKSGGPAPVSHMMGRHSITAR